MTCWEYWSGLQVQDNRGDGNMVIHNDCLEVMNQMQENSIDLVYLDPPFFTQKKHALADLEGKKYEFEDTWASIDDYISYMMERLKAAKRVLKDTGNIFLHCDSTASHYLRVAMDEIFGADNFRSEIIWCYRRWSNSKNGLLNAHQTILYYSKTSNFKFNKFYMQYSPTTNIDQLLQDRVRNEMGKSVYKRDEYGNPIFSNEKMGVPLSDVWEIPFLNPKAKERVGYPTQKPITLMERILEISTDKGDTVLDPFCGSGTTLVAASLMGRRYIGIDINEDAINLTKQRLEHPSKSESQLMKIGRQAYDTKDAYEKSILECLDCVIVQRNMGIDGLLRKRYGNRPVAVRIQKEGEPLSRAVSLLYQAGKKRSCSFTILVKTNEINEIVPPQIPPNMLLIESFQLTIQKYLDGLDSDQVII